jgi:hypothetical protein
MKLSSLQFVLQQFENERYKFFSIYDSDHDLQYSQMEPLEPGVSLAKLRNFLRTNTGYFEIYVFNAKMNPRSLSDRDKKYVAKYAIELVDQPLPGGVQGLTGMGSTGYGMLPPDDPRAGAPNMYQVLGQLAGVEQEMKLQQKDFQHWKEVQELQSEINRMKEEQSKSRGMGALADRLGEQFSDPQVLMGLIAGFSQLFNKQSHAAHPAPMTGVATAEDVITETSSIEETMATVKKDPITQAVNNNLNQRQSKMVAAINELQKADPEFPENIAKLADIARRNPGVYKMAIQYLKTL